MTCSRRLQMKAAQVLLLGSLAFRTSPQAVKQDYYCYEFCIDAVWYIHCPYNQYVQCEYSSQDCPFAWIRAYCVYEQ